MNANPESGEPESCATVFRRRPLFSNEMFQHHYLVVFFPRYSVPCTGLKRPLYFEVVVRTVPACL